MLLSAVLAVASASQLAGLWAASGTAMAVLMIHPAALAFEFAMMQHVNRRHGLPAPFFEVATAWTREVSAGIRIFAWRQPFRSEHLQDHLGVQGRRGVILIHGYLCNRGLWARWCAALRRHGVPYIAVNLEPVFSEIDAYPPIIEAAVRELEAATGVPPVVVAHSMGGLALRLWWVNRDNAERLHHVFTLGSPHRGTWLARLAPTPSARQMRPGSAWLESLFAAEQTAGTRSRLTCYYSRCDNIVFPATFATLDGAESHDLTPAPHLAMADHPLPLATVLRLVLPRISR